LFIKLKKKYLNQQKTSRQLVMVKFAVSHIFQFVICAKQLKEENYYYYYYY